MMETLHGPVKCSDRGPLFTKEDCIGIQDETKNSLHRVGRAWVLVVKEAETLTRRGRSLVHYANVPQVPTLEREEMCVLRRLAF